jgi:hypothetical protein
MVRAGIAASACTPMRALQAPQIGGRGPPYALRRPGLGCVQALIRSRTPRDWCSIKRA